MGGRAEFEFAAAGACVQRYLAVARGLVVFDGVGVFETDLGMVGWFETWDEPAGAVALTFVVVIAGE